MITKFIRKYLMNGFVTVPLMLCLILSTWNSIASNKKLTYHLSGEEMFKGVFFAEGKYAELIPELKAAQTTYLSEQLSVNENAALTTVRNQIIEAIKIDNPQYFNDFKATLQTASPSIIKEKIIEGQALLTKTAMELSKLSQAEFKDGLQDADAFLADHKSGATKNDVKKFLKEFANNDSSSSANNSTAACIAILLILVLVVVKLAVIPFTEDMEMSTASSKNSSNLMLEQVVSSVCSIAPQVV